MVTKTIHSFSPCPWPEAHPDFRTVDEVYGETVKDKRIVDALGKRIARDRANPSSAKSWTDVKARLRKSR
jgi:hypothetical protein